LGVARKTERNRNTRQQRLPREVIEGKMATQAVKVKNGESQGNAITEAASGVGEKITRSLAEAKEFLHDTRVELKQVTWPTREDVWSTTWVVLVTVAFFGVFLWLVDLGVERAVQAIFKKFGV
jgi:preprotein translocase subunit SecE